ncbi:ABC transporter-domain-containing protein [Cyathus striatus]|nr:ABC transporter-domain-containing protein [Cyathus striatus]
MSPVAMPDSSTTVFQSLFEALRSAPTAPDAKGAADRIAREISKQGLQSLHDQDVIKIIHTFALNKKSGYERESAVIAFQSLANVLGAPVAPLLLPSLPIIFDLYMDKGDVVRSAAVAAVKAILKLFPPEATRVIFRKWKTKVGVLDAFKMFVTPARDFVAAELGTILPKVEAAMHDTKAEVSSAAIKCATSLCTTLANPDLAPHIPTLVKCMSNPDSVPACIKSLSSTTFVAEVTAPALAVLVPLLIRALNDRSMEVQRRTVVVIDNLVKLVRDPNVAAVYLSPLVEGVEKIAKGAAFPEVRAFGEAALQTLLKSGASSEGPPTEHRNIDGETAEALTALLAALPHELSSPSTSAPNGPPTGIQSLLLDSLKFQAALTIDLIYTKRFDDIAAWNRCIASFMNAWTDTKDAEAFSEAVRSHFRAIDKAKYTVAGSVSSEEGEILCDTLFSLAYGALLLLSHTTLRLIRGRRYGILGTNGSGKSTLLRQLRDGKVENFPPQDQLRCVMVEHSLQGEDGSLSVLDFITSDPKLCDVPRSKIRDQLLEVGFDDARQVDTVGGLSGGWKMKLELARAMLYNADLLLLDELDRTSVKWLEDYLAAQKSVTCLIVSHDSGFLDNVTTDIIHYESKKLVYYPGNLSAFVAKKPEAKSFYTLAATTVKFSFPAPGSLMGVRSNTRAIMKLTNCTFTYPGRSAPSLYNVSCALSLSSRVGVVGPNGAGKSTLIKLLTGETEPQEGAVYKHPALRVGYVSQHATHHIERHLEKTPIGYIQWRFQDGHDRELLEKVTRVLTEEEKAVLNQEWVGKDGSKRKVELVMGRQKLKKSFQYEIKWRGLDHRFNTWIPREELLSKGFTKLVQQFDDLESSREGAGTRDTTAHVVRKHLEDIGLDGDIAQYNEIAGLSGGQKIKLVIAACLWNNPQICVLDEPSNFLDREALGGLAMAIKEWAGAVVRPEIWHVDGGRMIQQGKAAVVEDILTKGSGTNTPIRSRLQTPAASVNGTPVGSGAEDSSSGKLVMKKKKKVTRNQMKAQEERRRLRKLAWLTHGGPKPEDTDSD